MTLFDAVFGDWAAGSLMSTFGDDVQVSARVNDVEFALVNCIVREKETVIVQDAFGANHKVTRTQLVIPRDVNSSWSGIDKVQMKTTFVFDDLEWGIDESEGRGAVAITSTFTTVHLRLLSPLPVTFSGHHNGI